MKATNEDSTYFGLKYWQESTMNNDKHIGAWIHQRLHNIWGGLLLSCTENESWEKDTLQFFLYIYLFMFSFIHATNLYWGAYHMLGMVFGDGDTAVTKTDKSPWLHGKCFCYRWTVTKIHKKAYGMLDGNKC